MDFSLTAADWLVWQLQEAAAISLLNKTIRHNSPERYMCVHHVLLRAVTVTMIRNEIHHPVWFLCTAEHETDTALGKEQLLHGSSVDVHNMTALGTTTGLLYRMLSFLRGDKLQHLETFSLSRVKASWNPEHTSKNNPALLFSFHLLFSLSLVYASTTLVCSSQLEEREPVASLFPWQRGSRGVSKVEARAPGAELMGERRLDPAELLPPRPGAAGMLLLDFSLLSLPFCLALTWWIVTRHWLLIISGVAQAIKHGALFLHLMMRRSMSW